MRILYGVQTTGHGHLVRSTPLIRGLRARGHSVDVLLSGPPPDPVWAERIGPPFTTHPGLTFSADGGRIRYVRTALQARP
ncbi:MAG: glycosyltransferase, partial [Gammaproteobacteria bacterium]|nr:glycosyltransferase [Gammaproteobacteria bacterium]